MAQPFKHPLSGIYYLRRRLPRDVHRTLGGEYKRSLNTRDPGLAKSLYAAAWGLSEQLIERARAQAAGHALLTDEDIQDLAARWMYAEVDRAESTRQFEYHLVEGPSSSHETDSGFVDAMTFLTVNEAIEQGEEFDLPALVLPHIKSTLRERHVPMPQRQSAAFKRLESAFIAHFLKLSEWAQLRQVSGLVMSPGLLPPRPSRQDGQTKPVMAAAPTIQKTFESYSAEKRLNDGDTRSTRKTISTYQGFIRRFIELFGNLPINEITRDTIYEYRNQLSRMPSKGIGSRHLPAQALIAKAQAEGLPLLTKASIRNRLLALSGVVSHAVRLGWLAENPVQASGIARAAATAASRDADRSRRVKEYTRAELIAIFTSPIYTAGSCSPSKAKFGEAWYWLPLMLYYTGARREELAQLRVSDIRNTEDGTPYLNILAASDDDGTRGVKTASSRRAIPLHTDLLDKGFLNYVSAQPADGQVFPLLKANPEGYYGASFGKHWGKYLRLVVGIKSSADPFHGFRHTFKTLCRNVGIPEDVHDAITGHAGGSRVARDYGRMPLQTMAREMKKYPKVPSQEA